MDPTSSFTPEWARHAVWYQIYPERFANGDARNDPTADGVRKGTGASDLDGWQVHPWTADWYQQQPYERRHGKDIWFNLPRRRYGGDLAGIIQRLDYLHNLGVDALYLNPVFESYSDHKYDGATYHHIDPHFGPDPEGDRRLMAGETPDDPRSWVWTAADRLMLALVRKLHERGMRIIIDGVFNHVGLQHWAYRDVLEKQRQSRFADWFKVKSWRDTAAGTEFQCETWRGYPTLPEWRKENDDLAPGPRDYVYAATRRWMAPEGVAGDGIDGWRLDVADWLPHGFWKRWRALVKSINPEAYLTAEIIDTVESNQPYLLGDEFDAVMNYHFAFACHDFFARDKKRIAPSRFDQLLGELREAYPACVTAVMQNLIDSHDTARFATHVVNGDELDYRSYHDRYVPIQSRATYPALTTRKPDERERRLQRLFIIFQMSYLGAPMIYYGDEAGMWGANDPCCRKPMLWHDMEFAAEAVLPDGAARAQPDAVGVDWNLFNHYKRLIALRQALPALREGDYRTLLADDANDIFAFARGGEAQTALVIINRSERAQAVRLEGVRDGTWVDALNANTRYAATQGAIVAQVPPLCAAILVGAPARSAA